MARRFLLKLSGEALANNGCERFSEVAAIVSRSLQEQDIELGVVIGGGNIHRGKNWQNIPQPKSDLMGMLATVINSIGLAEILRKDFALNAQVLSALVMPKVCESYSYDLANLYLKQYKIVIFAAGFGNPFFTTDSAAVLRALEMDCELLLKATQTDGVYDKDPNIFPDAIRYEKVSYDEVLEKKLMVMDLTAITLAKEKSLPIAIFSLYQQESLSNIIQGIGKFTLIDGA